MLVLKRSFVGNVVRSSGSLYVCCAAASCPRRRAGGGSGGARTRYDGCYLRTVRRIDKSHSRYSGRRVCTRSCSPRVDRLDFVATAPSYQNSAAIGCDRELCLMQG